MQKIDAYETHILRLELYCIGTLNFEYSSYKSRLFFIKVLRKCYLHCFTGKCAGVTSGMIHVRFNTSDAYKELK